MGITFVQKTDPEKRKKNAKIALVLAGGAVSGGAYKVGGLKALNDYLVGYSVNDFDVYVGLSAGAFLAAPLSAGVPPEELLKSLSGDSEVIAQLGPFDFFYPNFAEVLDIPGELWRDWRGFLPSALATLIAHYPLVREETGDAFEAFRRDPSYARFEKLLLPAIAAVGAATKIPSLLDYLPGGVFDNSRLERYMRENLKRLRLPNEFRGLREKTGKELYITATNLDTAERVVFGAGEDESLAVSEAIQASTALPGFYKPARIKGVDYVDGAVRRTASLDVAVEHGADLVICYNPLRPFHNHVPVKRDEKTGEYRATKQRLADRGILFVVNQVLRTLLHTRLHYAIQQLRTDPDFKGDILLIEPTSYEYKFFDINPLAFWKRTQAAQQGYFSVQHSVKRHFKRVQEMLAPYGIELSAKHVEEDLRQMRKTDDLRDIAEILQTPSPAHSHAAEGI